MQKKLKILEALSQGYEPSLSAVLCFIEVIMMEGDDFFFHLPLATVSYEWRREIEKDEVFLVRPIAEHY